MRGLLKVFAAWRAHRLMKKAGRILDRAKWWDRKAKGD